MKNLCLANFENNFARLLHVELIVYGHEDPLYVTMPPTTRGRPAKRGSSKKRTASRSKSRAPKKARRVTVSKRPKRYVSSRKNRYGIIPITTLQPKQLMITVPYRQTLFFTDMGMVPTSAGSATEGPFKLCSNSLYIDMVNPRATQIISLVEGSGSTGQPVAVTTNPSFNLTTEIDPYFSGHAQAMVLASTATIKVTQLPNQYKLSQFGKNDPGVGNQGGTDSWTAAYPPNQAAAVPTLDGNVYIAMVKKRNMTTFPDPTAPIGADNATLHKLKTEVPGMVMRNIACTPQSQKSVTLTSTYTPRSFLGVSDVRDNQANLSFSSSSPPNAKCHTTMGIFNAFEPNEELDKRLAPPLFKVECVVNYKIALTKRKNVFDNNAARDHPMGEHLGRDGHDEN